MVSEQPTRKVVKAFRDAGWTLAPRQPKGSHSKWPCPSLTHSFILPDGHRSISPGVVANASAAPGERSMQGDRPMTVVDYTVTREGKWWMIAIPSLDGLTQARRLSEVDDMARDYVAVAQDIPYSQAQARCTAIVVDGVDVLARSRQIEQLHNEARRLEDESVQQRASLAKELVEDDVPLRDVGEVIGVSYQRVHQLVGSK